MALPAKIRMRELRRRARERVVTERNQMTYGATGAAMAWPFLQDRIPSVGPVPSGLVAAAAAYGAAYMTRSPLAHGAAIYLLARQLESFVSEMSK